MPCATPLHLPGRRHALSMGLKTENWWTPQWQDGTMVDGYQVCGFSSWHCLTDSSGGQVLVSLWALVPAASFLLASTGLFDLKICSLSGLPPGFQGLVPPRWIGCPRAMALTAASWAHIHPRLCCLAASCRIRARPFTLVPRLWVWVLPPFGHARTRTLVAAPLVCTRPSAAAPQVLDCRLRACASVAVPLAVARARTCLLAAVSRLCTCLPAASRLSCACLPAAS